MIKMRLFGCLGAGNIRADYYPFRVFDDAASTVTLINLCIVIIAILYTIFILKRILTQKKEFFMSILNILDLGQLVCVYAAIGFYTMRFIETTKAIDVVVNSKGSYKTYTKFMLTPIKNGTIRYSIQYK